jgi:hypothetical protein
MTEVQRDWFAAFTGRVKTAFPRPVTRVTEVTPVPQPPVAKASQSVGGVTHARNPPVTGVTFSNPIDSPGAPVTPVTEHRVGWVTPGAQSKEAENGQLSEPVTRVTHIIGDSDDEACGAFGFSRGACITSHPGKVSPDDTGLFTKTDLSPDPLGHGAAKTMGGASKPRPV